MAQSNVDRYLAQRKKQAEFEKETTAKPAIGAKNAGNSKDNVSVYLKNRDDRIAASGYEQWLQKRDVIVAKKAQKSRNTPAKIQEDTKHEQNRLQDLDEQLKARYGIRGNTAAETLADRLNEKYGLRNLASEYAILKGRTATDSIRRPEEIALGVMDRPYRDGVIGAIEEEQKPARVIQKPGTIELGVIDRPYREGVVGGAEETPEADDGYNVLEAALANLKAGFANIGANAAKTINAAMEPGRNALVDAAKWLTEHTQAPDMPEDTAQAMKDRKAIGDPVYGYFVDPADRLNAIADAEDAKGGFAAKIGGQVIRNAASQIPNVIIGAMTGGTSAAMQAQEAIRTAGNFGAAVLESARQMAMNPMFHNSVMQMYGARYEDAREAGADAYAAALTATITTLMNSAIEMGGGVENLPFTRATVGEWVKNALSEGKEEVIQQVIDNLGQKLYVDGSIPWYSQEDERAVINPGVLAENALVGTLAGGAMTAPGMAINSALGRYDERQAKAEDADRYPQITEAESEAAGRTDRYGDVLRGQETIARLAEETVAAQEAERQAEAAQTRVYEAAPARAAQAGAQAATETPARARANVPAEVSRAAEKYGEDAGVFESHYKGGDAETYRRGFDAMYTAGRVGLKTEQIGESTNMLTQSMDEVTKKAIWTAGRNSMMRAVTPGVRRMDTKKATNAQKRQYTMLDAVGKRYGIEFVIVDSIEDGRANGAYSGGRRIVVAADAMDGAIVQAGAHELVHYLKRTDADGYNVLKEVVVGHLTREDSAFVLSEAVKERMAEYAGNGQKLTEEDAIEEIVAEAVPTIFANEESVKAFVGKDRTLAEKVRDFIVKFVKEIREIAEKYMQDQGREEIANLINKADALTEIAETFDRALEAAGEKWDAEFTTGIELLEASKYSMKDRKVIEGYLEAVDSNILEAARMYRKDKNAKFARFKLGDVKEKEAQEIKGLLGFDAGGFTHNIDKNAFNHIEKRHGTDGEADQTMADLNDVARIGWVLANYDTIERAVDKNGDPVYTKGYLDSDGNPAAVVVYRKKINGVYYVSEAVADNKWKKLWVTTAFMSENKKDASQTPDTSNEAPGYTSENESAAAFDSSISDSPENVNEQTRFSINSDAFRRWFGDSKIVNEDGSPKVMYHGSAASFTAFDKRKARSSGLYGKGFYFTDSDSHAGQYGQLYQVYLKIQNPLIPDGSTVTKAQIRKFLRAVAKNEDDYSIENYGTYDVDEILSMINSRDTFRVIQDINTTAIGDFVEAVKLFNEVNGTKYDGIVVPTETVVFEPTQIKSATDNIGTYDPDNPDIRFSLNKRSDYGPNQPYDWAGDGTYTSFKTAEEARSAAEEMRMDVETEAFMEWFAGSKVVDEKGEPKIMYHGTSGSGFTQFDTYGSRYGLMGTGSYFTDDPEIAEKYTKKGKGKTPGIYPVYLSIQRPADMDQKITAEEAKAWRRYFGDYVLDGEIKAGQTRDEALRAVERGFEQEGMLKDEAGDYVVEFFESQGFDGITHIGGQVFGGTKHRVYIAFEPTQVKSATGNFGDFSAEDADIRFSLNKRYSYDELTAKPDATVVEIEDVGHISRDDVIALGRDNAEANAARHDRHGTPMVFVGDLEQYVSVGNKALGHGLDGKRISAQAPVVAKIGDILRESIAINEAYPKKDGVRNSWILIGAARQGEDIVLVRSIVNQSTGHLDDVSALYAAYGKKNRTSRDVSAERVEANAFKPPSGSKISIAELLRGVKESFGDIVSEDVAERLGFERPVSEFTPKLKFSLNDTSKAESVFTEEGRAMGPDVQLKTKTVEAYAAKALKTGLTVKMEQQITGVANKILKEAGSSYDKGTMIENLKKVIGEYAESGATEETLRALTEMSKAIIEKSSRRNDTLRDQYADLRKKLRETPISLTETQKQEAANESGSYGEWRKGLFGAVNLTSDGISLDSLWGELSSQYPDMFPPETGEAEMAGKIKDFALMMRPRYENPYGMDMDGAALEMGMRLQGDMMVVAGAKDEAKAMYGTAEKLRQKALDEYKEKLKEQKQRRVADFQKIAADLKAAKAAGDSKAQAAVMNRYRAALKRTALDEAFAEVRATYREREAQKAENRMRSELRDKAEKRAAELMEMLAGRKKGKRVPTVLQGVVMDVLEALDVNGRNAAGTGGETVKSQAFRAKLGALREFYERVWNQQSRGESPDGLDGLMMTISERNIAEIQDALSALGAGNKYLLREMDSQQLRSLNELLKTVKHTVESVGKLWKMQRYASVAQMGDDAIREMDDRGARRFTEDTIAGKGRDFFALDMMEPVSYGERLGEAGKEIIQGLMDGEKVKFGTVRSAAEATGKMLKDVKATGYDVGKWRKTIREVKLGDGRTVRMSETQLMSLYLTAKRAQGMKHLLGEGMTIPSEKKTGVQNKILLTQADITKMAGMISDQQRALADRMGRYLSGELAKAGNNVTQRLYLYDAFTEENYWPITSDPNELKTQEPEGERAFNAIVNAGFTKPVNQRASNPVIIMDAFDVFNRHVGEMASYVGYAEVMTDALAWLNYRQRDENGPTGKSVKDSMDKLLGKGGIRYLTKLIQDINGARRGGDGLQFAGALLRNYKIAAVAGKIRVAIQQPTSIVRAAAEINPVYLLKGIRTGKGATQEMQKWSSLAWWKANGNYDIGVGKGTDEILWGKTERRDAVMEKISTSGGLIDPGKMDDWAWARMWSAVKREVKRTRPDLKEGSDEYFRAVAERFEYVVDRTQVVDTVMHRSDIMRTKDGLTQSLTAFKSEPIKSYNMLMRAIMEVGRNPKDKKAYAKVARATTVFVVSSAATAAATALVDAFKNRDDDDELWEYLTGGEFGRDYAEAFLNGFMSNVNLAYSIPLVGEALEAMKGEDVTMMQFDSLSGIYKAVTTFYDHFFGENKKKTTVWGGMKPALTTISQLAGLPVSGLMANAEILLRMYDPKLLQAKDDMQTAKAAYGKLYEATASGDKKTALSVRTELAKGLHGSTPKNPKEIDTGVARILAATDERILKAWQMREQGNQARELAALHKEIQKDGFTDEQTKYAVNNVESIMNGEYESLIEEGKTQDAEALRAKMAKYGMEPETPEEKDMTEELEAKTYQYKHLFAGIRNGDTDDVGVIAEVMEAESDAKDPAKSIRDEVAGEFKAEYIALAKAGKTREAEALAKKLAIVGIDSEDIEGWVKDDSYADMKEYVAAGNVYGAREAIDRAIENGATVSGVASSLNGRFKQEYVDLVMAGRNAEADRMAEVLQELGLYYKDGRTNYFRQSKLNEWVKEAEKKE